MGRTAESSMREETSRGWFGATSIGQGILCRIRIVGLPALPGAAMRMGAGARRVRVVSARVCGRVCDRREGGRPALRLCMSERKRNMVLVLAAGAAQ